MKIIIELLKKDLLKFRWLLALWVALVVSWNVAPLLLNGDNYRVIFIGAGALKMIGGCFLSVLTILIMQTDAVASSSAFWLTRPMPPWKILVCKAVLLLLLLAALTVATQIATMILFHSPSADVWRKTLGTVGSWFAFMPFCVLVASITRNFFAALGILLGCVMAVIVFTMARVYWIFGDLTWVSMAALPLAGLVFQYYTRRTWLTVSGCAVMFILISALQYGLSGQSSKTVSAVSQTIPDQDVVVRNISVSDDNVPIISGEVQSPENWQMPQLDFNAIFANADGDRIVFNTVTVPMKEGVPTFHFSLSAGELEKIKGIKGTLHITVSGLLTHHGDISRYVSLTNVPLFGKQWTIIGKMRIIADKPNLAADRHSMTVRLLFVGEYEYISNDYAYALCNANGDREIQLDRFATESLFSLGENLKVVSLRATGLPPESLDGWEILIKQKETSPGKGRATFEIPDFIYNGN